MLSLETQVAGELVENGLNALAYHAGMSSTAREMAQDQWSRNKVQIIVGTIAFGLGISKPDVRFVLHHTLSKVRDTGCN